MSLAETKYEVEYPATDGQPMGETELHVHWTIRLRDILKHRYRGQRVYVGTDMFVYYVEGQPYRNVCPDVFVVLDCDPHMREIYKVWEEGKPPTVVFEITSKETRKEDELQKPPKYALIGVEEYFLYDPKGEYLRPALADTAGVAPTSSKLSRTAGARWSAPHWESLWSSTETTCSCVTRPVARSC